MAAPRTRIDLNVQAILIASCGMSTREVGKQWLSLLNGKDSEFSYCVVRRRIFAGAREAIPGWQTIRQRIFERDGFSCTYCGSDDRLECDHVVPLAKGGSSDDDNLTTACRSCNRAKRDLMPEEWLA